MTAEQLEELLAAIGDPNNPNAASCMADLWREAPSLARRVIAAEKMRVAFEIMENHGSLGNFQKEALAAYREASK